MEHRIILGGEQYLPFARNCVAKLKKLGLPYASQTFEVDGVTISVKITPGHEYIRLEGGEYPLYQFFTTGPDRGTAVDGDITKAVTAIPGYAVRVSLGKQPKKNDSEPQKLEATPTGSTAEASAEVPPAWPYSANARIMTSFLTFNTFQANGIPQHQFFMGAKGPQFIQDGWYGAGQISDIDALGIRPVRSYERDVLYDSPIYIFRNVGRAKGNANGFAPDTDWYRRGAATRVSPPGQHPEYGERFLAMLTDVSGNFYVFPVDESEPLGDAGRPYAAQTIKTTIPDKVVNKQKLPYPGWARPFLPEARRDAWIRDGVSIDIPHGNMRWEFSSDGKRMVCLIPHDMPPAVNGVVKAEPEISGKPLEVRESKPGLLELGIEITLTGPAPEEFNVKLTVLNEVGPNDERYIIAAQYYWGDIKDAHAPTGLEKDELVVMDMSVYHKRLPIMHGFEPISSAVRSIAAVKSFKTGAVIREFTTLEATTPREFEEGAFDPTARYGQDENQTLLSRYTWGVMDLLNIFTRVATGLSFHQSIPLFELAQAALVEFNAFRTSITEASPSHFAQATKLLDGYVDGIYALLDGVVPSAREVLEIDLKVQLIYLTQLLEFPRDNVNVMSSLIAYDLRALAFCVQTAAFKHDQDSIARQDRIQVIVRNEVVHTIDPPDAEFKTLAESFDGSRDFSDWVKMDHREAIDISKSLFAVRCIPPNLANEVTKNFKLYPQARFDRKMDIPVGASVYNLNSLSFICGDPHEIFTVHPAGHWSIVTRPLVYYGGKVKDLDLSPNLRPAEDCALPDDSKFVQNIVDIVSVQTVKDGGPHTIRSSHIELFNQAYKKNVKIEDFYLKFTSTVVTAPFTMVINNAAVLHDINTTNIAPKTKNTKKSFKFVSLISRPSLNPAKKVVERTIPLPYMDLRNYYCEAVLNGDGVLDGSFIPVPDRINRSLPAIRGSSLFGGTTIRLK